MSTTLKRALDVPHHNDRPTSPYSPADQGRDDDFICAKCDEVAWSIIPSLEADGLITRSEHITIRSLNGTFAELVTSRCPICRILAHIKPASLDGLSCAVKAIPAENVLREIDTYGGAPPYVLLSLKPANELNTFYKRHPSVAVLQSSDRQINHEPRLLQPNIIDYDMIKESIEYCNCNHHNSCPGSAGATTVLEGLRVIDIRTRTVIEARNHCKYAALSYVWGSQTGENASDEDPRSPPLVIEDAFAVCASLGLEFLWVDRCVSCCLLSCSSDNMSY